MTIGIATMIIGALAITAVVLAVIYTLRNTSKSTPTTESFTVAADGVTTTPQGAITGPVIFTNSLTRGDPNQLLKQAEENGKVVDTSCMVYGASNHVDDFNEAYKNQLKIQEIQDRSNSSAGFQSVDDLKEISKTARLKKDIKGIFQRDGVSNAKLIIDKNSTIGVIDEKYVPNRDRPKHLRAVGTAIAIPGFAFDATKALDSNGTGICPKGGVPGAVLDRKTKRAPHMTPGSLKWQSEDKEAQPEETATLEANGILSATTVV